MVHNLQAASWLQRAPGLASSLQPCLAELQQGAAAAYRVGVLRCQFIDSQAARHEVAPDDLLGAYVDGLGAAFFYSSSDLLLFLISIALAVVAGCETLSTHHFLLLPRNSC